MEEYNRRLLIRPPSNDTTTSCNWLLGTDGLFGRCVLTYPKHLKWVCLSFEVESSWVSIHGPYHAYGPSLVLLAGQHFIN